MVASVDMPRELKAMLYNRLLVVEEMCWWCVFDENDAEDGYEHEDGRDEGAGDGPDIPIGVNARNDRPTVKSLIDQML